MILEKHIENHGQQKQSARLTDRQRLALYGRTNQLFIGGF
jgi:hypothetical protein